MNINRNQEFTEKLYVDYTGKIKDKFYLLKESDKDFPQKLNSLIILLNYCFKNKNGFFIPDYNVKNVIFVSKFYNELKTNIFKPEIIVDRLQLFDNIDKIKIKNIVFILKNYISSYNKLEDIRLKTECPKESIKDILNDLQKTLANK